MAEEKQSLLSQISGYREWYFAFCDNEMDLPPWQKFFVRNDPAGLQHVYAFCQIGEFVLFVEPYRNKLDFVIKYPTEDHKVMCAKQAAQEISNYGHTVVRHVFKPSIVGKKTRWNWLPTCVTVIKVATGFASNAWTPKHLLHDLFRNGADIILPEDK